MAAHVVDELEEILNHHTRYSSDKASRNGDDIEYIAIRDSPSPSHSYEDRGHHTPPPAVRPSVPPRPRYGDNSGNSYAVHPTRHVNSAKGVYADREYAPLSAAHKSSFDYDNRRREGWDGEALWDDGRDHRDSGRERLYSREERDWQRDRDPYLDAGGHHSYYACSAAQRSGSYITPPAGTNRRESRDYFPMSDVYDTREPHPPSRGYSYRDHPPPLPPPQSPSPDMYDYDEYQRQESARVMPPTRQGLYSRRELGDRRLEDLGKSSSSSPIYCPPDSVLISPLIPDSRQKLRQQEQVAWKSEHEWAREDRDNTHFRGPPASVPSSSRLDKAQDYHAIPSNVRTSTPGLR
jgi:hypothetical protein